MLLNDMTFEVPASRPTEPCDQCGDARCIGHAWRVEG